MKMMLLAYLLLFLCCTMTVSAGTGGAAVCGFPLGACQNSGTCSGGQCSCSPGYAGELCGSEIRFDFTADGSYNEGDDISVVVNKIGADYDLHLTASVSGTVANTDYALSPSSFTIDSSSSSHVFIFPVFDDDESEPSETLILTLVATNGPTVSHTYTIAESDPVTLIPSKTLFTEGGGSVSITFSCVLPADTTSSTFNAGVTDGTATTSDYSFVSSSPYECTLASPSFVVDLTVKDDNIPETDEMLRLSITSPLPFTGLTAGGLDITIVDDDSLSVSLSLGSVSEGGSDLVFTSTTFSFPNGVAVPIPLTLTVTGGTAVLNTEFTASEASGVITFTYDESDTTSRAPLDALRISFPDDSIVEPDKTFKVTFTSDYVLTGTTSATVTIQDDEPETVTLTGPSVVDENQGTATYTLQRSTSFRAVSITCSVTASPIDTGLYNTNVQEETITVDFAVGDSTKTFTVTLNNDNVFQIPKSFTISASGSRVNEISDLRVKITEDEFYTVTVDDVTVEEGDPITVTFTRDVSIGELVTQVATVDGTAVDGVDFNGQTTSLTFADGASSVTLTIQTTEDFTYEASETFTVTMSATRNLGRSSEPSVQITITDDDDEVLTITSPSVDESAGTVSITISRTASFEALVVTAATRVPTTGAYPITADDITMLSNVQLTFQGLTLTFQVTVVNDEIAEPDETFEVTISAPGSIADVVGTVTIVNDDDDVVTLPSFLAAYENAGSKFITITRTVDDKEVTVQVNTNDGTAKAGTDYTGLTNHDVTFGVGSLTAIFSVGVTQDVDDEDDETFTLTVSGSTVETSKSYTFLIVDDDGSRPFDCRRMNQGCAESSDVCNSDLPLCECKGGLEREGDMCNIVTAQKDGTACSGVSCNDNGVCLDDSGVTSCACFPGYYGDDCEHSFLKVECFSDKLILLANPHGNFGGKIYVKDKRGESDCTAKAVPNPPVPDDNIDDTLDGFYLDVRHDSTACGVISPVEGATETSYSRQFFIQYDPDITTGVDQCVTVSCSFDRNSLLVNAGVVSIDPNGQYVPENAVNNLSPLSMEMDIEGTPVTSSTTVVLAKKLCVTLRIPEDFGGLEIIDIDFNNTLPADPKTWRVYTAGCVERRAKPVLINTPFYSVSGSKRVKKFCFFAFKFVNSLQLTTQVKVKICVDPDDCNVGTCGTRRKRQVVSSRETTVGATFNIYDPATATSRIGQDQTGANATIIRTEEVCNLPLEFIPTVIGLGVLIVVLVLLCLYLTYRLVRKSTNKTDKLPVKSFR